MKTGEEIVKWIKEYYFKFHHVGETSGVGFIHELDIKKFLDELDKYSQSNVKEKKA